MNDNSAHGPLLPLYNLTPDGTILPPPYTPPANDSSYPPSTASDDKPILNPTVEERRKNRNKAYGCIALAVLLLIIVPLAIFGGIVSKVHTNCRQSVEGGNFMDGDKLC